MVKETRSKIIRNKKGFTLSELEEYLAKDGINVDDIIYIQRLG